MMTLKYQDETSKFRSLELFQGIINQLARMNISLMKRYMDSDFLIYCQTRGRHLEFPYPTQPQMEF